MLICAFNKALVGAYSVITNLRVDLRLKLYCTQQLVITHNTGASVNIIPPKFGSRDQL